MLKFAKTDTQTGSKLTATDSGMTYEIHDKWQMPRGAGYAVFIRDADGKSITGNTSIFHSRSTMIAEAVDWCNERAAA